MTTVSPKQEPFSHRRGWMIAPLIVGLLSGCAPLAVLDRIVPAGNYERRAAVAYGNLERQKLDVYRPIEANGLEPVVVFFYGGSWKSGAREKYRFVAEALTRWGITVVIPDYRLFPEVTFPDFVHDAALAVLWTIDNLGRTGNAPRSVFLAGHSAGAHIAALLAVDPQYFDEVGFAQSRLCGVIGVAGPYAFDPLRYRTIRPVFAGLENPDNARPAALVSAKTPPFLLIHGDSDGTVNLSNTWDFAAALTQAGTIVRTEIIPGVGHYRIMLAMATPFDNIAPVNARIAEFVETHKHCE